MRCVCCKLPVQGPEVSSETIVCPLAPSCFPPANPALPADVYPIQVAERDVLLPAVAAILQASPAEFAILKRLFVNTTTPPAMQMLSALGFKLS